MWGQGHIDCDINRSRPRRKHSKYLDAPSGRNRLATISGNSAASMSGPLQRA